MAEKTLQTRIKLKYDTYSNWNKTDVVGKYGNLVLLEGEIGITAIPTGESLKQTTPPAIMIKVGDGVTPFKDLPWASALAADVYPWAKASEKPTYTPAEVGAEAAGSVSTAIAALDVTDTAVAGQYVSAVSETDGKIKVTRATLPTITDTNTSYQLVLTGHTLKLQSKEKGAATWTDVTGQSFTLPDTTYTFDTGDNNGEFKVTPAGGSAQNIKIKGLGALAYKENISKGDIGLGDVVNAGMDSKPTADSGNYITSGGVKEYVDEKIVGAVQYLGTVGSANDVAALSPDSVGDFCRVSVAFGDYHAGDILLCKTLKVGNTAATWDVIHGEIDKDTWTANSATADGYVTKGTGQANKVWKTDANGNPAWREDSDTKVTNTLSNTTKFYLTGTSSDKTNTGTQYFDSNVYVDAEEGKLHAITIEGYDASFNSLNVSNVTANSFIGDLEGNATTATTADKVKGTLSIRVLPIGGEKTVTFNGSDAVEFGTEDTPVAYAKNANVADFAAQLSPDNNFGSETKPVYFKSGVPAECKYELNATVPADAKFTDTTYDIATASKAGLVKPVSVITKPTLNSVTNTAGKYYQVQMSNDGNMFVNVPWLDSGDTKVTQAYSTANGMYPLLMTATVGNTATTSRGETTAILNNGIYANPSTGELHAKTISGEYITATQTITAGGLAVSSGSGIDFTEGNKKVSIWVDGDVGDGETLVYENDEGAHEFAFKDEVDAVLKDRAGNTIFSADAAEDVSIMIIDCGSSSDVL